MDLAPLVRAFDFYLTTNHERALIYVKPIFNVVFT